MKQMIAGVLLVLALLSVTIWFVGSHNPETPAGYVGYLTQGAVFGKTKFYGLQTGPTSPGRTWMLSVRNVSVTPYTYDEAFDENDSVLSKDNLKIKFRVHILWKIRSDRVEEFMNQFSTLSQGDTSDDIVRVAYENYLQEPLRTFGRDEIQQHDGFEIKDEITAIGGRLHQRILVLTEGTPFEVMSVVVGNIQYPETVANAVSNKMAKLQELEQKKTEIEIERADAEKRLVQAGGIAKSMEVINARLTAQYLQHEAIEAQKAMVNSPNHTTIYIPVGPMGVPLTGTFDAASGAGSK